MAFSARGLCPELLLAIAEAKYLAPTPVQTAGVPLTLQGLDVQASAPTGSGKTLAFTAPMLQPLLGRTAVGDRRVSNLVLA